MTTFVLVHGHWHGGWAFAPVERVLRARGHDTIAPDLPSDQPQAGAADNARAVLGAMRDAGDDAVLVGHSAGGLTIPLVARQRRVAQLVFVAALLAVPGMSVEDQFAAEPDIALEGFTWTERGDGLLDMADDVALEYFFHDCPPEAARAAVARLRPQTERTLVEVTPLTAWPDVPCAAIACDRDRIINPRWQRRAARDRLGVEPVTLDCGHSPARACPQQLADALEQVVHRASG
jgi:pimeloyl-ACP methyl ester carboxylesterase